MEGDPGLVLIHGAGLGSFIWDGVVSRLQRPTLPVEFPNRGKGDGANRNLTLAEYTAGIVEQVEKWGPDRIVLVAHSIGGCVALEVADRLGDRVAGLVGIGAAFPKNGESFISCLPFPQRVIMPVLLRAFGTKPPRKAIEQGLCSDLSPEQCAEVVERFTPESRLLYTAKVQYRSKPRGRWYIRLTRDREFPPAVQTSMIDTIGATQEFELESGHLPMMSQPDEVARVLSSIADTTQNAELERP